jgi:plastocyanin
MRTRNSFALVVAVLGIQAFSWSCRRADPSVPPPVAPRAAPPAAGLPPAPAAAADLPSAPAPRAAAPAASASGRVVVQLTEEGFVPSRIPAQVGKPITLAITRKTEKTCAHEIVIKGEAGKTELPLDKEVVVSYTPKAQGTVPFGCAMGMMVGGAFEVR